MKRILKKSFNFTLSVFVAMLAIVFLQFVGNLKTEVSLAESMTSLIFENSEICSAKILIDGEEIDATDTIEIAVGSTHSVQAVPNKYYQNMIVYLFDDEQYNDYLNPETNTNYTITNAMLNVDSANEFTFSEHSHYHIVVITEKIDYSVKLALVDDEMQSQSDLTDDEYFTVNKDSYGFVAKVKVDETVTDDSITLKYLDSKDWKFVCYKVKNQNTNEFVEIGLDHQFTETDLNKYLAMGDNGRKFLNIYAVFTKLYKLQVAADLEDYGQFLVAVDDENFGYVDKTSNYTENGVFTYYLTKFDKVKITAMPRVGKSFDGFYLTSTANTFEGSGNVCELEDIDQDVDVVVKFGEQKYTINFVAVDENKQILDDYCSLTKFNINNKEEKVVKVGDKINSIKTTEADNKAYKFVGYEIYSKINGWVKLFASNIDVNSNFIANNADNNNVIYIRACYVKTYKVSVHLEDASAGCGYFYLFIIRNSDNQTTLMTSKVISFEEYLDSGYTVMIQAGANVGYKFTGYTLENGGASINVYTKKITEDLNLGLIFNRTDVELQVSKDANNVSVSDISSDVVKVGDKVVFTYKADLGNTVKKIAINNVDVKKFDNIEVTENAVIIEVTSEFLKSINSNSVYKFILTVDAGIDVGFITTTISLSIILAATIAGVIIFLVLFLKAKKRLELTVQRNRK